MLVVCVNEVGKGGFHEPGSILSTSPSMFGSGSVKQSSLGSDIKLHSVNPRTDPQPAAVWPAGPRLGSPPRGGSHQLADLQQSRDGPAVAQVEDAVPGGADGAGRDDGVGHDGGRRRRYRRKRSGFREVSPQ